MCVDSSWKNFGHDREGSSLKELQGRGQQLYNERNKKIAAPEERRVRAVSRKKGIYDSREFSIVLRSPIKE